MLKNFFAISSILLLLSVALWIYWQEEFKHYIPIANQQGLPLNSHVGLIQHNTEINKPTYYHFFDEECTSARVNMEHVVKLISPYTEDFHFTIIVKDERSKKILIEEYQIPGAVEIVHDKDGKITNALKIQTTPYAAILDVDNTLYFRGNYRNSSGICGPTDIKWSAPALAMASKIKNNHPPLFQPSQLVAQGCRLN